MNFPTMNTLASGRFSNGTRLRSWIAGALLAVMGTVTHHAYAETFKYLRCEMTSSWKAFEPPKPSPYSGVLYVAFNEKENQVLEAEDSEIWRRPGVDTSVCQVNIAPSVIKVYCEPGDARSRYHSSITISRTTGEVDRFIGLFSKDEDLNGQIRRGSCVLVPSDPLIPERKLF